MKNTRVFPVKRLIRIVYAVMMFVILGTCIFGSGIYYSRKTDTVCANRIIYRWCTDYSSISRRIILAV